MGLLWTTVPCTTGKNWIDVSLPLPNITAVSPGVMSLPTGTPSRMLCHLGVMEASSPDLPQEKVSFPILWKGESCMWGQSSMELVCPRHAFPAPQTSQLTPAPPSPAAARELGDLVPTVTGPQHKKAAQGLGSGMCLERPRSWTDLRQKSQGRLTVVLLKC